MTLILSDLLNPKQKLSPAHMSGKVRRYAVNIPLPKLAIGDEIYLLDLPAHIYLHSVKIACDNLGKTGKAKLGVILAGQPQLDLFSSNLVVSGQILPFTDLRFTKLPLSSLNHPLWQLTGLPEATDDIARLVLTITQETENPGTLALILEYIQE